MPRLACTPRSLVWATEIDVLPADRLVERREDHLVIRSPGNPGHWWGNLLLFDRPPAAGDRPRWEAEFAREFGDEPEIRHMTFAWDVVDGRLGTATDEFCVHGYDIERMVGLAASPDEIHGHPRASRDVTVCALDARPGADGKLWEQVIELQVASRDPRFDEEVHRAHCRSRMAELRELFLAGRGDWYVALDEDCVVGSLGIVVSDGRGRFQVVDTKDTHRRRGICSRLVVDAARFAAERHGAERLVICADPGYHALGLYESLGFRAVERVSGVYRQPPPSAETFSRT
jgi:ribosomal protein S18 acetylase RimI-like enzyme